MFLAWNTGGGQQGGGKVMLLTEMEDISGRPCIWLGYFLRRVRNNMNNHIKILVRKAILICIP